MTDGRLRDRADSWAVAVPSRVRGPLARTLQVVAVLGALISVLVAVIGWRVVGAIDAVAVDSAEVTADALGSLEQTLDVAAGLITTVDETLVALEQGLVTTSSSLADGGEALESVSQLATDAAPALDSATTSLRSLESVATSIDSTLEQLSRLPIGPDYDPESSFGSTVSQLADDLEPLSESFGTTAEELDDVTSSTVQLQTDLEQITLSVQNASSQLDDSGDLIEQYRQTADRARATAETAGVDLGSDLTLLRLLLLAGGLVFAAGQVVPWMIGRALLDIPDRDETVPTAD